MITAFAIVQKVMTTAAGYRVELSCHQESSCDHCASKKTCGTGVMSKAFGNNRLSWTLTTKQKVVAGQKVEIGFPTNSLLTSTAIIYLLPLIMLILGAIVGEQITSSMMGDLEITTVTVSIVFALLGFLLAKKLIRTREPAILQQVVLVRVFDDPIENQ